MRNNRYRASIPSHNSSHQTVSSIEPISRSQTTSIFNAPFRNALKANWEKCKIAQYLGGASSAILELRKQPKWSPKAWKKVSKSCALSVRQEVNNSYLLNWADNQLHLLVEAWQKSFWRPISYEEILLGEFARYTYYRVALDHFTEKLPEWMHRKKEYLRKSCNSPWFFLHLLTSTKFSLAIPHKNDLRFIMVVQF